MLQFKLQGTPPEDPLPRRWPGSGAGEQCTPEGLLSLLRTSDQHRQCIAVAPAELVKGHHMIPNSSTKFSRVSFQAVGNIST